MRDFRYLKSFKFCVWIHIIADNNRVFEINGSATSFMRWEYDRSTSYRSRLVQAIDFVSTAEIFARNDDWLSFLIMIQFWSPLQKCLLTFNLVTMSKTGRLRANLGSCLLYLLFAVFRRLRWRLNENNENWFCCVVKFKLPILKKFFSFIQFYMSVNRIRYPII